jgi:hypothetical protein
MDTPYKSTLQDANDRRKHTLHVYIAGGGKVMHHAYLHSTSGGKGIDTLLHVHTTGGGKVNCPNDRPQF